MPSITPVLLSDARVLAAYVIFAGSYLVFALGKFPWMKIDRPGAAIIGAVLMVAFGIVGGGEALASVGGVMHSARGDKRLAARKRSG